MKILSLKIIDNDNNNKRDIKFNEAGVSFILGNVTKPKDNAKTSNSIGKTLLLKMIDYVYGANEDHKIIKKQLNGYQLIATVKYNDNLYVVKRILGNSKNIFINDKRKTLDEYKEFFNLNRQLLNKQIYLTNKTSLISYLPKATEEDYLAVLKLLNLDKVCEVISKIYEFQKKISKLSANKKQLLELLNINNNKIGDEIFLNDKEVDELTTNIKKLNDAVAKLNISNENQIAQEKYSKINSELKKLRYDISSLKLEKDNLYNYINDTNDFVMTSDDVVKIYEQTKIELPGMIKRSLSEVNEFYTSIIENRLAQAKKRVIKIEEELNNKKLQEVEYDSELELLANILSTNDAYKNAIEILYAHNNLLQEKKFKQGQLAQIDLMSKEESKIETNLAKYFNDLNQLNEEIQENIKQYKNFVFDMVKNIYDEDAKAVFNIVVKKYSTKNRPISIDMSITGDSGEGVNEVKNNIIDYLIFNFNKDLDMFIHDSSCYNGIDPRQVSGLIKNLISLCKKNNKQVILAINKYQLSDDNIIKIIESNACITLSEKDKLLNFDF